MFVFFFFSNKHNLTSIFTIFKNNIGAPKILNKLAIAILDFSLFLPIKLSIFQLAKNNIVITILEEKKQLKIISFFGRINIIFGEYTYPCEGKSKFDQESKAIIIQKGMPVVIQLLTG